MWPAVLLAIVTASAVFVLPRLAPDAEIFGVPAGLMTVLGGAAGGLAIAIWWLFFSRAPWSERIGAIVLIAAALLVTRLLVHQSIAGAGMGMLLYIMSIPFFGLALVVGLLIGRHRSTGIRRAVVAAAIIMASAPWTLIRTAGVIGGGGSEFHWRWTPTPEELLLTQANDEVLRPLAPAAAAPATPVGVGSAASPVAPEPSAAATPTMAPGESRATSDDKQSVASTTSERRTDDAKTADASETTLPPIKRPASSDPRDARLEWPGFRGPHRDGVVPGVRIATDWSASPPAEIWRRPIGPGWSSFAVHGDLLYTQEQRGEDEIVACYRVSSGEPVWRHRDPVRFWESNGGAGPRATPTIHDGRIYAFGATGILNALDAKTGARVWSRNVSSDTGRRVPDWGFSSSPLVVDDLVVVAAAGTLAAYDRVSGEPRWRGPSYGGSYSSPHFATIDGVPQIVLLGGPGAISVAPDGAVLWEHKWSPGAIVQPAVTADGDLVVNALAGAGGLGTRRLAASHGPDGWRLDERWTSNGLKPYFNDFVIHKGHAFGFDGSILSSINLQDGARNWKGGRYGNGQMLLLADQDVLLVISEDGELALVSATTDGYRELARFPALTAKTWNHPVLVGDVLLVRNGEEMAAFRMPLAGRETR